MREDARTKGRRYASEGRLRVLEVHGQFIRANCNGGGDTYRLGHDSGGWFCSCPALTECAHLVALKLVVSVSILERGEMNPRGPSDD